MEWLTFLHIEWNQFIVVKSSADCETFQNNILKLINANS